MAPRKTKPPRPPVKDALTLSRKEAAKRVEIMASFIDHPGWEIYEYQLKRVESYWLEKIITLTNSEERAIAVGVVRGMRQMFGWPVSHAKACQEAELRERESPGDGGFSPEPPEE
jgi:hypothetical protein